MCIVELLTILVDDVEMAMHTCNTNNNLYGYINKDYNKGLIHGFCYSSNIVILYG